MSGPNPEHLHANAVQFHPKPDEVALFNALRDSAAANEESPNRLPLEFADAIGAKLGISSKRVHFLLYKWSDRGWWNYGVTARSGWLEDEAPERLPIGTPAPPPAVGTIDPRVVHLKAERIGSGVLSELPEYSGSVPTGNKIGRRWRRNLNAYDLAHRSEVPLWVIGEYVSDGAGGVLIHWTRADVPGRKAAP